MNLHIWEESGRVVGVSISDVPEDFTDIDVRYSVESLALAGDVVAAKALPHVKVCLGWPIATTRVYLDD
jgi:hypothetical protein